MQAAQASTGRTTLQLSGRTRVSAASRAGRCCLLQGSLVPATRQLLPLQRASRATQLQARPARRGQVAVHAGGDKVPVRFTVQQEVNYGETVRLVGSHSSLGNWKVRKGAAMKWEEGHVWSAEVSLPPGTTVEFKCVRARGEGDDADWEDGDNRSLAVPSAAAAVELEWGGSMSVDGKPSAAKPRQQQSQDWSSSSDDEGYTRVGGSMDDSSRREWKGRELRFMRSNEHSRDRQGVWDTSGLEGGVLHLVEGDRDAANWLAKMEVVKKLLVDSAPELRPELDALAAADIYMQWVATGALPCVEGGGHHRPNRHAELARSIFRSLEWVIGERGPSNPEVALVGRRLQSRLPSFTDQFTQSTPLTRIRDIAHRNDIPHDLKAEIKHTLQNKLHRNAGPEDLHTTEAMLARVTANPGEFNDNFVNEFRTFTSELRDFFNAGSLTDMLQGLRPGLDDGSAQVLDHFGATKGRLDGAGEGADQNALMDVLHAATSVRAMLVSGLTSGLRNDAPDNALAMRQKWRQCEIRTEDYAFVLLSRFVNSLEQRGGASTIAGGSDGAWALPIGSLVLGLRHIGLSGYNPTECMAVEQELTAWQKLGGLSQRENALRLRASLQRLRRVTEGYSQLMLDAYAARSAAMGKALGLEPHLYQVFTEAEIRASLVFQVSKLSSLLIKAANECAGGNPWDVVMAGTAEGVLLRVDTLEPGCLDAANGKDAILVVSSATGDEEVASLGANLRGIVLQQDLPHLSHLGVRTRQEGVPFVTCEDLEAVQAAVGPLLGNHARLTASAEGVQLTSADGGNGSNGSNGNGASRNGSKGKADAPKAVAQPGAVEMVKSVEVIPLEEATVAVAGAKAAACGELLRLAAACGEAASPAAAAARGNGDSKGTAILAAPDGVVLPFGCMEAAAAADGKQQRLQELLGQLDSALADVGKDGSNSTVDSLCSDIQGLLSGLALPQQALQRVAGAFKPEGATVIVRSSANVEDLAGMSGAGLYDSIPNINSGDGRAVQQAVAGVWASLFSRRAVMSRRAAGVPQKSACMAVVVQRQMSPDLCFVLHTLSGDEDVVSAELAPGLGETLASGTRGSPWRLEAKKSTSAVTASAFANFSQALLAPGAAAAASTKSNGAVYAPPGAAVGAGSNGGGTAVAEAPAAVGVSAQVVDYSREPMSVSEDVRTRVGMRLLAVAAALENEFGGAQDVEGCFVGDDLYVVQTRPQP
ncbi:Phosphoglucan [Chlorella vulgaris]